jgi:DNA end-binding protein Ku
MQIEHFTTLDSIDPVYYDTTYYAVPAAGSEKQFELLRLAMMDAQIAAVAKTVLNTRETLFVLIPRENGIMAQTMFYHDEVRQMPDYQKPEVSEADVKMASGFITQLKRYYEPDKYKNEFIHRLRELMAMKEAQQEIVQATPEKQGKVYDFMEAL